jgi:hypothetical protein
MIGNKRRTEAAGLIYQAVEERRTPRRRSSVSRAGARASENAGMSNDNAGENPARRKPKVSWGR